MHWGCTEIAFPVMKSRDFLNVAPLAAAGRLVSTAYAQVQFAGGESKLKMTGVSTGQNKPRGPVPTYTPAPGSWSTNRVEVANPMSIYPEYKASRSLFQPDPAKVPSATVEISTDKGIKGYGSGGPGAGDRKSTRLNSSHLVNSY